MGFNSAFKGLSRKMKHLCEFINPYPANVENMVSS